MNQTISFDLSSNDDLAEFPIFTLSPGKVSSLLMKLLPIRDRKDQAGEEGRGFP